MFKLGKCKSAVSVDIVFTSFLTFSYVFETVVDVRKRLSQSNANEKLAE